MHQDTSNDQDGQHILDQIVIPALPPKFHHSDIARHYQDGVFTSRLDAEIADILHGCQKAEESGEIAPLTLSGEALEAMKQLNCIALIQDGRVLPLLNIEQMPPPVTAMQRVHAFHAAARVLLEAIAVIYQNQAQRAKHQDDDSEGEYCNA